jgi:Peptidase A4 family
MTPKLPFGGAALVLAAALNIVPAMAQDAGQPGGEIHLPMRPYLNSDGTFRRFRGTVTTSSWSGYAVTAAKPYTSASATWQVPDVSYDGGKTPYGYEYVLNWTGVGGYGDSTLIQLGTESMVSTSGAKTFYTWYELYPAVSQNAGLAVKPGDIVTASLQCTAACSPSQKQTWQLTISDNTTRAAWTQSLQYQSSMASAEWITEPPYYNGYLPLADYDQATYDPVEANGQNPNLSLAANGIIALDQWGQTSNPSAPANGDVFSTCWGSGSLTPCTAGSFTPPPPVVTASLVANPRSISAGQSSTLSWTSTNATSCTGSGFIASGTSGSAIVSPSVTTSYSVSCSAGTDPTTAMATVTVSSTSATCHGKKCG